MDLLDKIPVASHSFCLALLYLELSDNYTGYTYLKIHRPFHVRSLHAVVCKVYLNKDPNTCLNVKIKF